LSEYQYYEFVAVDRRPETHELEVLRSLSTRADITPTSFVNTYEWGNFRGDPRVLVERYFDAFLYLANWGTRELILRFPARLIDLDTAQRYCVGDTVSVWGQGGNVIVTAMSEEEQGEFEWGGEGVLASILPVRAEVLAGDERALYLLWLLSVQIEEVDDDVLEPAVPERLDRLSGSQAALVEFLRIDRDLLGVAAGGSATSRGLVVDVAGWVESLDGSERDGLLVALIEGKDPLLRAETLRRVRPDIGERPGLRTAGQLRTAAAVRRAERERVERERRKRAAAERTRRAEDARREHLAALAAEGEKAWGRVAARIAEKRASDYDVAAALLVDLREVTAPADFSRRIEQLRHEHTRKPAFLERLTNAGL
jgi:hypothetical protein